MSATVTIGTWHEREARDVRQSPSYYAADYEVVRTRPGDYPARLEFVTGYTVPMPYWLHVRIEGDRTAGVLFSGFGGVNFAAEELPREPAPVRVQTWDYTIPDLIAAGKLTLAPAWSWLADGKRFDDPNAPQTWADSRLKG